MYHLNNNGVMHAKQQITRLHKINIYNYTRLDRAVYLWKEHIN